MATAEGDSKVARLCEITYQRADASAEDHALTAEWLRLVRELTTRELIEVVSRLSADTGKRPAMVKNNLED